MVLWVLLLFVISNRSLFFFFFLRIPFPELLDAIVLLRLLRMVLMPVLPVLLPVFVLELLPVPAFVLIIRLRIPEFRFRPRDLVPMRDLIIVLLPMVLRPVGPESPVGAVGLEGPLGLPFVLIMVLPVVIVLFPVLPLIIVLFPVLPFEPLPKHLELLLTTDRSIILTVASIPARSKHSASKQS